MDFINLQGSSVDIDTGYRFADDFFLLLNFIKLPKCPYAARSSVEQQCDIFYRDIMNYGFVDSHNQHLKDGRFDLAAKNLNEINNLSIDPLTGLRKKEFLKRKLLSLENEIYLGTMQDFSLIICDLDKFKEVNDSYGHTVGDDTLALFGKLILETLRPGDFAYRYGGEEFLILLPETNMVDSAVVAERLRLTIEDRLHIGNYGFNRLTAYDMKKASIKQENSSDIVNDLFFLEKDITCSFGVANYLSCEQSTDILFTRADEKLYVAKANGRNKVEY